MEIGVTILVLSTVKIVFDSVNRGHSKLFKHCCPLGSYRGSKPCTRHRVWSDFVLIVARSWPYVNYNGRARVNTITPNLSSLPDKILGAVSHNLLNELNQSSERQQLYIPLRHHRKFLYVQ